MITTSTTRTSEFKPFENWVYFLQKSRLIKNCPCCSGPIRHASNGNFSPDTSIILCEDCASSQHDTSDWFVYADYRESCNLYGQQWIYSRAI